MDGSSQKNLLLGVNKQFDPANLTDLERRHIPTIEAPAVVRKGEQFLVDLEVGRELHHPNDMNHFIEFIDLYADETYLARADLTAEAVTPRVIFSVVARLPFHELRAYARCNLHGTWVGTKAMRFGT